MGLACQNESMINIVLVSPQIPPNTGNVIRLCANTGAALHLVKPMGFTIDHSRMRRAGLDYHEFASMTVHEDWLAFKSHSGGAGRMFAITTRDNAAHSINHSSRQTGWSLDPKPAACQSRFLMTSANQTGFAFRCKRTVAA